MKLQKMYAAQQQVIKDNYRFFDVPYNGTDNDNYADGEGFCCNDGSMEAAVAEARKSQTRGVAPQSFQDPDNYENLQFFYHPDHLGSSSFITNLDGEVVQHIEYVPFGEVFIEERNNVWNTPYLFNAKEFDEETGMYYYGARYYDQRLSLWMSTDPMQENYPSYSSYCYSMINPIRFVDYDGNRSFDVITEDGNIVSKQIDDGVNGQFRIAKFDFDLLQFSFNNDQSENKADYNQFFEALGLGTKGYDVALSARSFEGSTEYAFDVKKGDFPPKTDKCNKFVYDMLYENNAIEKCKPGCPPRAGMYANPNVQIKGLNVVTIGEDNIHLGDIVAGAHNYAGSTASGHVEIVTYIYPKGMKSESGAPLPNGFFRTTGAGGERVLTRSRGYDMLNGKTFKDRAGDFKYNPVTVRRP